MRLKNIILILQTVTLLLSDGYRLSTPFPLHPWHVRNRWSPVLCRPEPGDYKLC